MLYYLFGSGQQAKITGVSVRDIENWCHKGMLKSHRGGKGTGSPRQFTPMQVVGLKVGNMIRRSPRGCVSNFVGQVVESFAAVDEKWLKKQFAAQRTHFVTLHQGKPILDGDKYGDWVNVQEAYEMVQQYIAELTAEEN